MKKRAAVIYLQYLRRTTTGFSSSGWVQLFSWWIVCKVVFSQSRMLILLSGVLSLVSLESGTVWFSLCLCDSSACLQPVFCHELIVKSFTFQTLASVRDPPPSPSVFVQFQQNHRFSFSDLWPLISVQWTLILCYCRQSDNRPQQQTFIVRGGTETSLKLFFTFKCH